MSVQPLLNENVDVKSITAYEVITLLLDGAMTRIEQAMSSLSEGEIDEATVLINKAIGIVGGLRSSLDLEQGEIATNLDALYEYIVVRLQSISEQTSALLVLQEVKNLLQEVYVGWCAIAKQ